MRQTSFFFVLILTFSLVSTAHAESWIRANQIGYLPNDPKIAILSSDEPLEGTFTVGTFTADIGEDQGAWGPFAHNYRLNFSELKTAGDYQIIFADTESLPFTIGEDVYDDVPGKLIQFMQLQRCGMNPVTGELCHQEDAIDTITGESLDLRGGWHDAGDRLKHMITTSYCVAALYLADQKDEADWGADLLKRIHPNPDTIYVQIGDDRDHMPPATLWHDDQSDYGHGPGGPRSAWRATGQPEGPKHKNESSGLANLAGRTSAALTLAGDLDAARSLYTLAKSNPGNAMSVPVRAPYYYGESTYHDDLQWAATELYIATGDKTYLDDAISFVDPAGASRWMGNGRHGHYEFFPYINLAHWRLYPHADEATQKKIADYYRDGLERVRIEAEKNPYRLGTPLVWCSTNDVIAFATQAQLYEQMTGDTTYRPLAAEARDWIFGRNPWGVSFVIGVPENGVAASKPHHLFWKLADHLPVGGMVDGPVYKDINDGLKFGDFGDDTLARFQSDAGIYHNVYADFSTNEPIIDGTVSLLLLIEVWQ